MLLNSPESCCNVKSGVYDKHSETIQGSVAIWLARSQGMLTTSYERQHCLPSLAST